MKKNMLILLAAGSLFLTFSCLSISANAQSYVLDTAWTTTRSGTAAFMGFPRYKSGTAFNVEYATDVAVDAANNIYIADERNNRVLKFSPAGMLLMTLGGTEGASNEQFSSPYGVAVDAVGNVYVADTKNHRVQKFSSGGHYLQTIGIAAPVGELGVERNELKFPSDVAVDAAGNVYVSMSSVSYPTSSTNRKFHCIKKFEPPSLVSLYSEDAEKAIDCVEREYPRGDPRENVTEFEDGEFIGHGPTAIALDAAGNIYAAAGSHIMIFGPDGGFIGQHGGWPETYHQTGKFRSIKGLDIAGDKMFVTEFYFTPTPGGGLPVTDPVAYNYRFQRCNFGDVTRGMSGAGLVCEAFGSGVVHGPWGIGVNSVGDVFISDALGILKFKPLDLKFKQPPLRGYIRGG